MAPAVPKYLSALHKNSTLGTGTDFSMSTAAHEQFSRKSPHSPALHEGQFSQSIHNESGHIQSTRGHHSIAHVKHISNNIGSRLPSMQDHLGPPALRPIMHQVGSQQSASYAKGAASELRMRHAYRLSPKVRKAPFPTTDKRSTGKKMAKSKHYLKDHYPAGDEGFLQEDSILSNAQY